MSNATALAPVTDFTTQTVKLTRQENRVLLLIGEGLTSAETAANLYVSKRTVDFHLANIYNKLNVSNRMKAYRRAEILGLLRR